jgi:hypothetical protein
MTDPSSVSEENYWSRVDKELLWFAWGILKSRTNTNLPIGITDLEATLAAIAPRLKAEGLREAADALDDDFGVQSLSRWLRRRADALSPQVKETK